MPLPSYLNRRDVLDLARLATPVALSRASFMLMGLTDAVVLARHAPGQLPHILNAFLPVGVAMGFGLGLVVGVQVLTAELAGAGRDLETGRIVRRGLAVALLYGVASAVVCIVIAGPLCESGDIFTRDDRELLAPRLLPRPVAGDLLTLRDAGAYGYAMSSNYNSIGRAPQLWLEENGSVEMISRRETLDDLLKAEGTWPL